MGKGVIFKRIVFLGLGIIFLAGYGAPPAAEKINFGTSFKGAPNYDLLMWAAQEKGIWKENGLEIEWFAFRGGVDMYRAAVAGAIDMGVGDPMGLIQATVARAPLIIVADFPAPTEFQFVVRYDGPIKKGEDLKGGKIGVAALAGTAYAYGVAMARGLGIEKDVRFIALGGLMERLAATKTGIIDAFVIGEQSVVRQLVKKELRSVTSAGKFLPPEWTENSVFVQKDFPDKKPAQVKKAVAAIFQTLAFIRANRSWAAEKMKAEYGHPDEAAKWLSERIYPGTKGGEINPKDLENVQNFMVEYGLIPKEKALALERLYTTRFLR